MKKKFKINEPVLKTNTLFFLGYSHKELGKEIRKLGVTDFDEEFFKDANGGQPTLQGKGYFYRVVWTRNFEKTPIFFGTLCHEITHLVFRICDWKGIYLGIENNSDELPAYLIDFYVRECTSRLLNKSAAW